MGRPLGGDDPDQAFLDRLIALALDVVERARVIKDLSDEPEILVLALEIEGRGLVIQRSARKYRARVKELKKKARCGRAEISE